MLEKINKNLTPIAIVIAGLIIAGAVIYTSKGINFLEPLKNLFSPQNDSTQNSDNQNSLDDFAKCLTEKGVKFYGAWWCPHCQNQKKMFGDSFQYVNYIECEKEPEKSRGNVIDACLQARIEAYPTWDFPGGEREMGEVPLEKLSELSGCPIK